MSFWSLPAFMLEALLHRDVLLWLANVIIPGWCLLPIFSRLLPSEGISWYFASRTAALGLVGYAGWILSHDASAEIGESGRGAPLSLLNGPALLYHTPLALTTLLLILVLFGAASWVRWGRSTWERIRLERLSVCIGEAIFLVTFAFAGALRLLSHGIVGQEKFMDMAFLQACISSTTMPPADPWLYDQAINYYYGGYAILAVPAKVLGTIPSVAYNVAVSLVHALAACMTFALARDITGRVWGGLLGFFLVAFAGNLSTVRQFAQHLRAEPHAGVFTFDWWAPSRAISDSLADGAAMPLITEFPFFAAFHADLHPHYMVMPFSLLTGMLLLGFTGASCSKRRARMEGRRIVVLLATCWSIGALIWINPFDALGWLLLAGIWTAWLLVKGGPAPSPLHVMGITGALLFLPLLFVSPFLAAYSLPDSANGGGIVGLTRFRTSTVEFLLVWGIVSLVIGPWAIRRAQRMLLRQASEVRSIIALVAAILALIALLLSGSIVVVALLGGFAILVLALLQNVTSERRAYAYSLALAAILMLLAAEVLHFEDGYGIGLQRMNTVFKMHYIAWVMLGLAMPAFMTEMIRFARGRRWGRVWFVFLPTLLLIAATYPILSVHQRLRDHGTAVSRRPSLDGFHFMQAVSSADANAIRWMQSAVPPGSVVLEAAGPPYQDYARVSTFTPARAVIGWANHQQVWRGSDMSPVVADVDRMYSSNRPDEVLALLRKYQVQYVFAGSIERRDYPASGLEMLDWLLTPVYRDNEGGTIIYQVPYRE